MGRWKVVLFTLCAVCALGTFVPQADAQVVISVGHHHHHRHHRHHHHPYRR